MSNLVSSSLRNFDPNAISNNTLSLTEYLEKTTVTKPPAKNDIRYIMNDPKNHRQKYDGFRWRPACTWHEYPCENLASNNLLCPKHNAQGLKKTIRKKSRKTSLSLLPLPKSVDPLPCNDRNVDDDVEIIDILQPADQLPQYPSSRSMVIDQTRQCIAPNESDSLLKEDSTHFNQFSIDFENDGISITDSASEPQASTSHASSKPSAIEYADLHPIQTSQHMKEIISRNIPMLTRFEEEYVGKRLIETCSQTCSMSVAQQYLYDCAFTIVHKNYGIKMQSITPDYFYDFLIRYPHIAIHYRHWFAHCDPQLPSNGNSHETKFWTLAMMVRGTSVAGNPNRGQI